MRSLLSLLKQNRPKLFIGRVVGVSMAPTFMPGAIVLAVRNYSRLSPGDIVLVRHDGLDKIKRIHYIDASGVFVIGDNREQSTDSRTFGSLPLTSITAKVIWPQKRLQV